MSDMIRLKDKTLNCVITVKREHAETVLLRQDRYVLLEDEVKKEEIELVEDKKEEDLEKVSPVLNVAPPKVEKKATKKRGRPKKKTI